MTAEQVTAYFNNRVVRRPRQSQVEWQAQTEMRLLAFLRALGHGEVADAVERAETRYHGFGL